MRITSKGQVTIPLAIRKHAGLLPHTEVEFVLEGNTVVVRKARSRSGRGRKIVKRMTGAATRKLTTDEIMALTRGNK